MHLTCSPVFYKKNITFPRPYFDKPDFVQYTSSSVTFANTLIDEIKKSHGFKENGDDIVIWNQDYHLMQISEIFKALLKEEEFTREENRKIHIGQFIHTPFFNIHEIQGLIREDRRTRLKDQVHDPFAENIESVLQKITWGMLANDFIGFHTKEYCDNYLEALEEWFPVDIRVADRFYEISYQDQVTTIGAFPIGLDVDNILFEVRKGKRLSYRVKKENLYKKIKHDKSEKRIIFGGLERCDYTKGLIERLAIFGHAYRKLQNSGHEARFYQVSAPSRLDNADYQKLGLILDQQVEKINAQLKNSPVIYLSKGIPVPQNYRFMKEIDVMMVTPLEDGMNLVAFEYILSQKYKSPQNRGILVLSTSGASRVIKKKGFGEMDGIVYVNPMRPGEAGERICQALNKEIHLSEEVIHYVEKERRIEDWADKNIEAILNCRKTI
jgi:trehalose 6-phosphate synthase